MPDSEATIGVDFSSKITTLENGKRIKTHVWDTAGQEAFRSITKVCIIRPYLVLRSKNSRIFAGVKELCYVSIASLFLVADD